MDTERSLLPDKTMEKGGLNSGQVCTQDYCDGGYDWRLAADGAGGRGVQ